MPDILRPSAVRVFAKSLHLLAAGWMLCVGWLWVAELRQHIRRQGTAPQDFAASTLVTGMVSALVIETLAVGAVAWAGRAPVASLDRREWRQAFLWAAVPNLLLLGTAYLMILEGT